jgi:hypothetical protein
MGHMRRKILFENYSTCKVTSEKAGRIRFQPPHNAVLLHRRPLFVCWVTRDLYIHERERERERERESARAREREREKERESEREKEREREGDR